TSYHDVQVSHTNPKQKEMTKYWYYRKYIDVRRGGIGRISMLLTGYCVLCYIWNYPHLKKERWRKYH
uniref:ATP synthase membrane subunit f n=1 Tax=Cyprinus carpio carpio TaxID=630221 RepID=A0A9J7XNG4_CYPCA